MKSKSKIKNETLQVGRYILVGLVSNLVLLLVFLALISFGVAPSFSAGACYFVGVAVSYLGNRRFTFSSEAAHRYDLPRFGLSYAIGFIFTVFFINQLIKFFTPAVAQAINVLGTAFVLYVGLKLSGFGSHARNRLQ